MIPLVIAPIANRPDSEIDFSDQEEITHEKIDAGIYRVVSRGGVRVGAGCKLKGKLTK